MAIPWEKEVTEYLNPFENILLNIYLVMMLKGNFILLKSLLEAFPT